MGLTQLVAPSEEPLDTAAVRDHLRYVDTSNDAWIDTFIPQARERLEKKTGRALITQQWRQTWETWPDSGILYLAKPPLVSVQAVSYLDQDGARQTITSTDYLVTTDTTPGSVRPAYGKSWPSCRAEPGSIRVDYTCGYGAAAAVPSRFKGWMLLALGVWDKQREAIITGISVADLPDEFFHQLIADDIVGYL